MWRTQNSLFHFFFQFFFLGSDRRVPLSKAKKKTMNVEELTDYEAERAARIAANRARLGEAAC